MRGRVGRKGGRVNGGSNVHIHIHIHHTLNTCDDLPRVYSPIDPLCRLMANISSELPCDTLQDSRPGLDGRPSDKLRCSLRREGRGKRKMREEDINCCKFPNVVCNLYKATLTGEKPVSLLPIVHVTFYLRNVTLILQKCHIDTSEMSQMSHDQRGRTHLNFTK